MHMTVSENKPVGSLRTDGDVSERNADFYLTLNTPCHR